VGKPEEVTMSEKEKGASSPGKGSGVETKAQEAQPLILSRHGPKRTLISNGGGAKVKGGMTQKRERRRGAGVAKDEPR